MTTADRTRDAWQGFGYAPRFLAAAHCFLTARETYKLTANIHKYFVRWADGHENESAPDPPEGTNPVA